MKITVGKLRSILREAFSKKGFRVYNVVDQSWWNGRSWTPRASSARSYFTADEAIKHKEDAIASSLPKPANVRPDKIIVVDKYGDPLFGESEPEDSHSFDWPEDSEPGDLPGGTRR
jgi:hypothetical protein